jgi:NitT/TauT family transport system ATP-binding protein/sulfonate transport system ATP-binding protein
VTKRPPKIEVQGVSHGFFHRGSPIVALREIELAIDEGEVVCVVGPSGCGKTTLLNAIAGFIRPTRGRVLVDGREVAGPGADRGVVFQDYALFRWLSVQGNVEFGLRMRGVVAARRRELADQYIRLVGLGRFRDRYPYELSGGMQQRVAIARVFANESTVLLMDEPFASLDAQTREIMQEELLQLWSKMTKTIFFITHSVDEAIFIATRVVVMTARPGRIKRILNVELPGDRFSYHIRTSPEFVALKDEVLELVREETTRQAEEA